MHAGPRRASRQMACAYSQRCEWSESVALHVKHSFLLMFKFLLAKHSKEGTFITAKCVLQFNYKGKFQSAL